MHMAEEYIDRESGAFGLKMRKKEIVRENASVSFNVQHSMAHV